MRNTWGVLVGSDCFGLRCLGFGASVGYEGFIFRMRIVCGLRCEIRNHWSRRKKAPRQTALDGASAPAHNDAQSCRHCRNLIQKRWLRLPQNNKHVLSLASLVFGFTVWGLYGLGFKVHALNPKANRSDVPFPRGGLDALREQR